MRLFTPDGDPVELGMLAETRVVVQLVRYFGCLPCQQYLRELDRRSGELAEVGIRAVAIGGSADYQARWLRDTGVSMPLLLDPAGEFRAAVGLGDLSLRQMAAPRGLRAYASAVLSGVPIRRPTADLRRSPGIAVLDRDLDLRWTHEGGALGDYPPLDAVMGQARAHG
ncbi:MAG: redoxin family protein [Chloroflexota bacterium]